MGIPKFFRWMNDKYPGLLVQAREDQIPVIDNFYLDMNGIIHNCTHPCDGDVHFRITESEMFEDIFNYVTTLFRIIRPKEYFFLAVDGVAPRAKMNQQRGRRFRSAKEATDREDAALKKGDILPSQERFDSNCITPGTPFMVRLNKALRQFIEIKLSTDPEWRNVKVILSGHETPGEGEHKVMDFIRFQRSQPSYNPETRHCLYGLDTDLIMLGLCCHEPNFMLLREDVKFNNKKSEATKGKSHRVDPTKITFNVLYISVLRQCIDEEYSALKKEMKFEFNLEAVIDDWILICFLIGNDFIPHLPHFHIHKGALPTIFEVYQSVLTKLDGYLNENGILNMRRFRFFAKELARSDMENYKALLKENGGDCAKDDFSKLNMFVRQKMRVPGARDYGGHMYANGNRNRTNNSHRSDNQTHHSHFQQSEVWYKIKSGRNNQHSMGSGSGPAAHSQQLSRSFSNSTSAVKTPNSKAQNGASNNRVGVHSFTEEQLNNSITVYADGDIIDVSDDEYQSNEKFPGESKLRRRPRTSNNPIPMNRRSTPKKDVESRTNGRPPKPSSDFDDFQAYKRTYYREKLKLEPPSEEAVLQVVREYVRALQWNLHYYYHGCMSWDWYYPYHYAPFISDIVNFKNVDVLFSMGKPFKPYDQLLSVLPAASSPLLPRVYQNLVTAIDSPLAKYFPSEVEYDLNGKQNDWEAVVLAPFIDQGELRKATDVLRFFLSNEERNINSHGPHLLFYNSLNQQQQQQQQPTSKDPRRLRANHSVKVECKEIPIDGFILPMDKIKFGLLKKKVKDDDELARNHVKGYKNASNYRPSHNGKLPSSHQHNGKPQSSHQNNHKHVNNNNYHQQQPQQPNGSYRAQAWRRSAKIN